MTPSLAVIYSRISHDPLDLRLGVERQEQDCLRLVTQRQWDLARPPYRENDTSASTKSLARRPVYEAMLADLQAGAAQVLVCYSTSRLTRRPMDYERLIRLVLDTRLQIATVVSGAVDLATADGRAIARVLAAMDAAESERTGERISRASQQRAERGEWHGGPIPPYGYVFATVDGHRTLVLMPERAALVREAADRVLTGESLYRIRQDWNARGLTSSADKPWRSQAIRRMLVRGAAAGYNERRGQLYRGAWEPILDEASWQRLRTILLDPTRDTRSFAQRSQRHVLTGLLWCGVCEHLLRSSVLNGVLTYWCADLLGGCSHIRIKAEDTERFLLEEVQRRALEQRYPVEDDAVLLALRLQQHQLQDDHYDNLLSREDFLRQTARLRIRIADRRREGTCGWARGITGAGPMTAQLSDPEPRRRAALRTHLERVEVGPHPKGVAARCATWEQRRLVVGLRLRPVWLTSDPTGRPPDPPLRMEDPSPWAPPR
jgi:DNA invertase Pin-like site-specific DNA recombinase